MKLSFRQLVVPLVGLACLPSDVLADGVADYEFQVYQERFFDPLHSTQSMAMGGSMLAVTSDSTSTVGNPAGLGFMTKSDVALAYTRSYISGNDRATYKDIQQDKNSGYAMGAVNIDPQLEGTPHYGTVGFGWAGSNLGSDDIDDADGDAYQIALAYGIDVAPDWAVGYGVGYYNDDYSSNPLGEWEMTDGVRQTVGVQHQLSEDVRLGLMAFYGFGTQELSVAGFDVDNDINSFGIAAGATHMIDTVRMGYGVDYTNYNGDATDDIYSWAFRAGFEVPVYSNDYLFRAGYRYQGNFDYDTISGEENAKFNAVSFGAALKLYQDLSLAYAAEYRHVGDGDWSHMVSLQYPFSLCKDA